MVIDVPATTILRHPSISKVGQPGFEWPNEEGLVALHVNHNENSHLSKVGIKVTGSPGHNNQIILAQDLSSVELSVNFEGASDSFIVIERQARIGFGSRITINGDGHTAILRRGGQSKINLTMRSGSSFFYYGADCSSNGLDVLCFGNTKCIIGEDCMIATGVTVRTFDSHAIFDVDSKIQINCAQDVVMGPHVWLGQHTTVMPGVTVGTGSVIGAGAIVTKSIPARCVAAGVPARAIRMNASWTREATPSPHQITSALTRSFY